MEGPDAGAPLLYDSADLTTHAVVLGMTGSGKTGLCIDLLEEAAIDGIPALVIDPKGDMANLALNFPKLRPRDFEPWVDPGEAQRAGRDVAGYAAEVAGRWKAGLASWGQAGARIQRLRDAAEVRIYTPGGTAGTPLALLRGFAAPPPVIRDDPDAMQQRLGGAVSGLLALLGIDADPLASREFLLLANILQHAWGRGEDLDLPGLLRAVQAPPFQSLGFMDLESVFPARDRMALAMRLNGLLASPGMAAWSQGEPLDIERILWDPRGRPRLAVLSIAHLSDAERMFFVTTLLEEVVAWMRTQPGTSSLRALVYMDEVFGYLPPVANPPSKRPLLTLLKQARAFGLGVVLATQNPVDVDYKALSNAGTWFLGRLQTERDVARVLDGLESAGAQAGEPLDRGEIERLLAGLGKRCFLVRNVHEAAPALFETRWALSYLKGPVTREEIRRIASPPDEAPSPGRLPSRGPAAAPTEPRPALPPGVPELFARPAGTAVDGASLRYVPHLLGEAELHHVDARKGVDHWTKVRLLVPLDGDPGKDPWPDGEELDAVPPLDDAPREGGGFAPLASAACRPAGYKAFEKSLVAHLYRHHALTLRSTKKPKLVGTPGESEAAFRRRLAEACRELRDTEVARLRKKLAPRLARLRDRVGRAEERVAKEEDDVVTRRQDSTIQAGTAFLGALFGRKVFSRGNISRAGAAVRSARKVAKEERDVERAREKLADLEAQVEEMTAEIEDQLRDLRDSFAPDLVEVREVAVRPRKSDTRVGRVALLWIPE